MKWIRYDIDTTTDATDAVCAVLAELGITSVEIKDNVQLPREELDGMFIDVVPDLPEDDGKAVVSFYVETSQDEDNISSYYSSVNETETNEVSEDIEFKVKEALKELSEYTDIGPGVISRSVTQDADWADNWKQFWHTFNIDDLIIRPIWEKETPDMKGKTVLKLDPGTAFGTGTHETTRLMIKAIKKYISPGDRVLDIGCGSGILSVVSLLFGAESALGVDLDKNAVTASYKNAADNDIPEEKVRFVLGNIISDESFKDECGKECYDLVYANILPDVLVPLSETVGCHLKSGGYLLYSGILDFKTDEVLDSLKKRPEFVIEEVTEDGEWRAITARKK